VYMQSLLTNRKWPDRSRSASPPGARGGWNSADPNSSRWRAGEVSARRPGAMDGDVARRGQQPARQGSRADNDAGTEVVPLWTVGLRLLLGRRVICSMAQDQYGL